MNARGFIQYSPLHTVNEAEPPLFPDIMENDDRIKFYTRKTHFSRKNRQTLEVFSKEDGINSKRKENNAEISKNRRIVEQGYGISKPRFNAFKAI